MDAGVKCGMEGLGFRLQISVAAVRPLFDPSLMVLRLIYSETQSDADPGKCSAGAAHHLGGGGTSSFFCRRNKFAGSTGSDPVCEVAWARTVCLRGWQQSGGRRCGVGGAGLEKFNSGDQ